MTTRRAVIFDMDGVLVRTDEYHYLSWCEMAAELDVPFDRHWFDTRLRGLARRDATATFLENAPHSYSEEEQREIAQKKNERFWQIVRREGLRPIDGALRLIAELRQRSVSIAVGSSSRNARQVLDAAGLMPLVDAVVDGSEGPGKPQPDIFLKAAQKLGVEPAACVVVEDALDGIEAARRAGMAALAVGPAERFGAMCQHVESLAELTADRLLAAEPGP